MKKIICILLSLILALISCEKRDWTNPFDSACPKEMWTPTNFTAVQEGTTVKLTWSQPISNISGFKILKGIDGATATSLQDQTKGTTQITDNTLTGGKVHLYSLTAFAGNNTSNMVTAQVTPVMTAGITTAAMSSIAGTTANGGGTITSDGGAAITARGVCWGTTQTPTIAGSKTSDGTGSGTFTSSITGLSPGTTYYARAYAINSVGTAYGSQVNFTTSIVLPALATTVLSSITATTATSGGTITTDGGATITARGVCWGTTSGPVITGNKTTDGNGTGTFTSSISGLTAGTTYYVRAYATNSLGTAYGNELTLTTNASLATLTTTAIGSVASTTATSGGTITNSGGATITARGVCWATTQTPTIAGSKSTDGTGTGAFNSSITGLTAGTTYYVRAYAINSAGTAYGNELTFTTSATMPVISTTAISAVTANSASSGGTITTDGGATITARGVCWATAAAPTITGSRSSEGTGTGTFTSTLTGLTAGVTYYVRAYATNSAGTSYGNEITFSSSAVIPTITTSAISSLTGSTAASGGNITVNGGAAVTARGVCYGTATGPTIAGSKTTEGTGSGIFTSAISGLIPGTTYYIRAYAINSAGTAYGNEISFKTILAEPQFNSTKSYGSVTDIDGNVYKTIVIGTQTWMAENLKTITYKDGTPISLVTDNAAWAKLTTGGYSWYNNDATNNKSIYGALYNWYTVGTAKLCPTGWRVPTDAEWTTLATYLGGTSLAGGKLKELGTTHWLSPNTGATNETGFTALSGGGRSATDGSFNFMGNDGNWWSSLENSVTVAYNMSLYNGSGNEYILTNPKTYGYSVRCIAEPLSLPTLTTNSISGINYNSATCGGIISSDGGFAISARGICWGTTPSPTIANSKSTDGTGTGSYVSLLTGLTASTTYYVRSYATTSAGTAYGAQVSFTTSASVSGGTVTDVDGNVYKTVTIGTQVWMAENLKTTRYRNGESIAIVTDPTAWTALTTGAYCWYNNDATANKATYGALYNWYAATDSRNIAPTGWHVPTDSEWTTLTTYLGGDAVAGGKLKESGTNHWASPNTGATNETGFTAVPGGFRYYNGSFPNIGLNGYWWSSGDYSATFRSMDYLSSSVSLGNNKTLGLSVRCVKGELSVPTISTTPITNITSTTATSGGTISSDGGTTVTSRGICWSTSPSPTITNSKTNDGIGTGSFTSTLAGLAAGTTYYVRAYATNSAGTAYGAQVSFTTAALGAKAVTAGQLSAVLTATELSSITKLTLTGTIDARDFKTMRDNMPLLAEIDLSGVTIAAYSGTGGTHPISPVYLANSIPGYAFCRQDVNNYLYGKTGLASIVLPTSITSIDERAFTSCIGLTSFTIPSSVLSIGPSVFYGCSNLVSLTIPSLVNTIGSQAFQNSNISVIVDSNNQYFSGLDGLLFNKLKTTVYYCPATKAGTYTVPASVNTLGTNAFGYCNKLTAITLPSSLYVIGYNTFELCTGLTSITIPSSVNVIESYAFQSCTGLTSIYSYRVAPIDLSSYPFVFRYLNNSTCTLYVPSGSKAAYQSANQWRDFTNIVEMPATVSDVDGNSYPTVTIGTQVWMASNLKTTKYNDNTAIPLVTDAIAWENLVTPGYCWYNNDATTYKNSYGALYNWYAVNTAKLCPTNWHVPSDAEWTTLTTYLGGESIAGGKLKETGTSHWLSPNTGATNETGFTALPGRGRYNNGAFFNSVDGYWWSSSVYSTAFAWYRVMYSSSSNVGIYYTQRVGFSVRCVRDF